MARRTLALFIAISLLWGSSFLLIKVAVEECRRRRWSSYAVIDRAGAGRASLITYVTPAVAVLLGIGVLGEDFGVNTGIGLALILGGSWLTSGGRLATPRARRTELARR